MNNLRILLFSLVLAAILLTVRGLKSVEGQHDSPGLENAMVEGPWRNPATATTQVIPEADGRNNIQRYLVQNCVVDVSSSSSMSIVSQGSTTDEEEDEEGRRLTNGGHRNTGSSACTVEVVTTSTASMLTVSAPPLSPVEDSLSGQDRYSKTDHEPKIKGPTTKTKGPKTKGPKTKAMEMKMVEMKMMGMKEKEPTASPTADPTITPTSPTENPTATPCIPDKSLCNSCINDFPNLQGNVSAGGQLYICDNTNITVIQRLTIATNTTISCCNNCAVGFESKCVLERGFAGDMFYGSILDDPTVRFELQRMVLDGNEFVGTIVRAVVLANVDFFLTDSVVNNLQAGGDAIIEVSDGSMTAINSVIQNNVATFGAVYLFNSNGLFQRTVFSNNVANGVNMGFGGAFTAEGSSTVFFFDSTFQMNSAPNSTRKDIGGVNVVDITVTCDVETICNSNGIDNKVFIDGATTTNCTDMCPL